MMKDEAIRGALWLAMPARQRAGRLAGRTLDGGFVLDAVLPGGEGGFGIVYEAQHPVMGAVAVKVLGVDVEADDRAYRRFKQEVNRQMMLSDVPNVVDVCGAGLIDGLPWYAMKRVPGITLDRWLLERQSRKTALTHGEIRTIICEILKGLAGIQNEMRKHEVPSQKTPNDRDMSSRTHLVHRDIKPSNIMIVEHADHSLDVKIIDFGIAGIFITGAAAETTLTQGALLSRTPEYQSPEMMLAPKSLDQRSDIFQVGLIAFEMMTGKRYWGCWPECDKYLERAASLPAWLVNPVRRALQWDREQRFVNAAAFLDELEPPPSRLRLFGRALGRNPLLVLTAVCLLLVICLATLLRTSHKTTIGLEAEIKSLKTENQELTEEKGDLKDKVDSKEAEAKKLTEENGALRIELAKNKDPKTPNAPPPQPPEPAPPSRSDLIQLIREAYDKLAIGGLPQKDARNLKKNCQAFVNRFDQDPQKESVRQLHDWLDLSSSAKVRFVPIKFKENEWGWNEKHPLRYRFEVTKDPAGLGQHATVEPLEVNDELVLTDKPSLELAWNPEVCVTVTFEYADRNHSGKRNVWLGSKRLLQDEPGQLEDTLDLDQNKSFSFVFKVERLGLGPLPPRP